MFPMADTLISMVKENYADWEETIQILEGHGPIPLSVILTLEELCFFSKMGWSAEQIF